MKPDKDKDKYKDAEMTRILRTDSHLHLYGAINATDLWEIGEKNHRRHADRLAWFDTEYFKVTGKRLNSLSWWSLTDGFDIFRDTFLIKEPLTFEEFQARFNLIIALCPPDPSELSLAEAVLARDQIQGGVKEYRTFIPPLLDITTRHDYVMKLLQLVREHNSNRFCPRIAFSLVRDNVSAKSMYYWITDFLEKNKEFQPYVTGLDFCGNEAEHPPHPKASLFSLINSENEGRSFPLQILYHVGEMWSYQGLASSIRWIVESAKIGSHRLGHCTALGINPILLKGEIMVEPLAEFDDHANWLKTNAAKLSEYGYHSDLQTEYFNLAIKSPTAVTWHYDDNVCRNLALFQDAVMMMLKEHGATIECCLTSNYLLGKLQSKINHPITRFLKAGLQCTISTDDPGIFMTSLEQEEVFAKENLYLTPRQLKLCEDIAHNHIAANL